MKRILSFIFLSCLLLTSCGQKAATSVPAENAPTWQEQYDLGIRYLSEGNYEEAIIAFTAAIEIDPKRVDSYLGLADTYEAMGDSERAAQVIEDAITALGELEELLERKEPEPEQGLERQGDAPGSMTLLMRQDYQFAQDPVTLAKQRGQVFYRYDEHGYLLGWENPQYSCDVHTGVEYLSYTDYAEYSYDGETVFEHSWCVIPDGRIDDKGTESLGMAMPGSMIGTLTGFTGMQGLCMDPYPGESGAYWLCPSQVENGWPNSKTDWVCADVTYDDRGYPIAYTSYDASGQITGTAELYWEIVEIIEE